MNEETFEVLDGSGRAIGVAPRSEVHAKGLWHRAAHVFLFRSDGRLVLQRRAHTKDVCPGAWDLSVAEHLKPGETYVQGAARGLHEELGIENVFLETFGEPLKFKLELPEKAVKDYEFQQCFRGEFDGQLVPDSTEVAAVRPVHLLDLRTEIEKGPDRFTPWFLNCASKLLGV